ncbi:MAG: DNA polymerase I [Clostridia bacterium]|nr:DNA polymerase I [Clostridia bacterium]
MKKLLAIDGNSIINRAFYGIRPLTTATGKNTNAIFGMINIITRQLEALRPDYAAVAFDLKAPTFRKKLYDPYKAGRRPTPPELLEQFDDAKACLSAMGIHVLELEGYEADDLLGTVATMASDTGDTDAYILSGDRDLLQLIAPHIRVLLAGNSDTLTFDRDAFYEKYGVEPSQLIELKGLMGDSSDNIPGVTGVGEKTAVRMIQLFGNLEGVYENIDSGEIAKGLREKLLRDRDNAFLSRTLGTIETHVPIEKTLADLTYRGIDRTSLLEKFTELEFSALIRKFGLLTPTAGEAASSATIYRDADADAVLALPSPLSLAYSDGALYLSANNLHLCYRGPLSAVAGIFDGSRRILCFDGKPILHALYSAGIDPAVIFDDLMLYAYVRNAAAGQPTLASVLLKTLGVVYDGNGAMTAYYNEMEEILAKEIEEIGSTELLRKIELPLSPILARMEHFGFRLDREGMERFGDELLDAMNIATERIYQLAGREFNVNSPKQLAEVLFTDLSLPAPKKTKTGYSTNAEVLESLRQAHPIVEEILEYRQVSKLYSTYAVGLLKVADENGRIHTEFKQALTATGRLSSAEPNLQNIPIRTALGRRMRQYFITENEDYLLVDADYSQIELRLLACLSGDAMMIDAFNSGADIHRRTAAAVFHLPEEAVNEELRKRAKAVNFGIVYGIGAYSLAQDLKISNAEAKRYIDGYFATYPSISEYLSQTVANAAECGYTTTLFGRRREIPELAAKNAMVKAFGRRVAMNSPIQGTAADLMKLAMIRVDERLRREGVDAHLVMQVHDELIVEAHKSDAERVALILREEMASVLDAAVKLTVDVTIGTSWLQ